MRLAACVAAALALSLPAAARAELVPGTAGALDGALALSADGVPQVAAIVGGRLVLASRGGDVWTTSTAPALPSARAFVAGLAAAPGRRVYALVEEASGRWLVLAERGGSGWRLRVLVRHPGGGALLGLAGLTLDGAGRPVVAYALVYPTQKTLLWLVRPDRRGRYRARAITRAGFPPSRSAPSAAPVVLPGGEVRVVETFSGAAIEWAPIGRTWEGQFLHASQLGSPAGPVAAAAAAGGVWSAWTELYPSFGESHVLLTLHRDGERTVVLHRHAFLVALALAGEVPEVAANDYVTDASGGAVYAGLVLTGSATLELGGKLVGYAAEPGGAARQLVLAGAAGLEWYRADPLAPVQVTLTAAPAGPGAVALSGAVAGASGGSVELVRERAGAAPEPVATLPLGADGTFAATDVSPAAPLLYRAVYRGAPDALPYGSLLRMPLTVARVSCLRDLGRDAPTVGARIAVEVSAD